MKRGPRKSRRELTDRDLEALHAAFVAPPTDDRPARTVLADLARKLGVPLVTAKQWAILEHWYVERDANHARAWLARYHPSAPLDLEGFAAYWAANGHRHLELAHALASGREAWFRAVAPIPHWEAVKVILEARRRIQAEREASRRAA